MTIKELYTNTMVEMVQNWFHNTKQIFEILADFNGRGD